jgi:transposase-like protein
MSNSRHHDPAKREAAIADYYASNDKAADVAARHGIPRATFAGWVGKRSDGIALEGGRWVLDPVARVQRWVR